MPLKPSILFFGPAVSLLAFGACLKPTDSRLGYVICGAFLYGFIGMVARIFWGSTGGSSENATLPFPTQEKKQTRIPQYDVAKLVAALKLRAEETERLSTQGPDNSKWEQWRLREGLTEQLQGPQPDLTYAQRMKFFDRLEQIQMQWSVLSASRKKAYKKYLKSAEWKQKRLLRLELAGYQCENCHKRQAEQVHHLQYPARLGEESVDCLLSVCGDCHCKIHRIHLQ
jgi:hypothetical protein